MKYLFFFDEIKKSASTKVKDEKLQLHLQDNKDEMMTELSELINVHHWEWYGEIQCIVWVNKNQVEDIEKLLLSHGYVKHRFLLYPIFE
jgi:hypothetical protein